MKRLFTFIISVVSLIVQVQAQDNTPTFKDLQEYYPKASIDEQHKMDSIFSDMEIKTRRMQVKTIGGIPFGISRDDALVRLKNKFGEPQFNPATSTLSFRNIKYAGHDFDAIHFLFESDGINSYLNSCIFIKEAKTKEEAIRQQEEMRDILSKKYEIFEDKTPEGFATYGGGISPLWDGHWYSLSEDHYTAIHTDIIKYENDLVDIYGVKYAARLIYGPYSFINEEF